MPREIRRKIIDNDLAPPEDPDDFEKSLESQLAADFDSASDRSDMGLMMPHEEGDSSTPDLFDFGEKASPPERAESSHGFSLDAFEPTIEEPPEPEAPRQEPIPVVVTPPKRVAFKKIAMIGAPCFLLVLLLSLLGFKMLTRQPAPAAKRAVTQVRKQIVVPRYQEKADFFIMATAQEGKHVVSLSIELEFHSEERHQSYQVENTLFRDLVYRFLEAQHPPRNTLKDWQNIVQKDLTAHLQSTLPSFRADLMRVSRLERL